jgi:hypothetical protein
VREVTAWHKGCRIPASLSTALAYSAHLPQGHAVEFPQVCLAARTYGVEDVPVAQGGSRTLRTVLTQT